MGRNRARFAFCRFTALLIPLCFVPRFSLAADHYVCAAATGTGDGSSWTNACTDFTGSCASQLRGDTYWVAAGNYGSHTFNTPTSGTSVITIKAPTDANHGASSTGWTNGGTGTCHQGQAIFTADIHFATGYWTFDGSYRGAWNDSTSYGFQVNNHAAGNTSFSSSALLFDKIPNFTVQYVDVNGSHDTSVGVCDEGLTNASSSGASNIYIAYNHLHDAGNNVLIITGLQSATVEYNWLERNWSKSVCHGEGIAARPNGGMNNLTIRYNYLENMTGTAFIATPGSGDNTINNNWYIYGNVFFYNSAENNPVRVNNGDSDIDFCCENNMTMNNVNIFNNTFANESLSGSSGVTVGVGWSVTVNGLTIQNNLWSVASKCGFAGGSGGVVNNLNSSYQACLSVTNVGAKETNTQIGSFNPFLNAVNGTAGADNFHLAVDTAPWTPLSDITRPDGHLETLTKDMDGVTRISSRGAFQFTGATITRPAAPTGLAATVH